jgi:quercetin dioxygenase-like cupin family protein
LEGFFIDIFHFDAKEGRTIEAYGSHFTLNAIGNFEASHVIMMTFSEDDEVGRHEAPIPQLFLVIEGSGWVTGDDGEPVFIDTGDAAFWTKGEIHGAGTQSHMKAIVIESESLSPEKFMARRKSQ